MSATPALLRGFEDRAIAHLLEPVRLRARRRASWLAFTGRQGDAVAVLDEVDAPEAERRWLEVDPALHPLVAEIAHSDATLRGGAAPRWSHLVHAFGLSRVEADVLLLCAAVALDPPLGRLCAGLGGALGRPGLTLEVAARLFEHGRTILLGADSPLIVWDLVQLSVYAHGEPHTVTIDTPIARWLAGHEAVSDALVGNLAAPSRQGVLPGWPVEATVRAVRRVLGVTDGRARVCVSGPDGIGRGAFAAAVADSLGVGLLSLDVESVDEAAWPTTYRQACRQARLDRSALSFVGARFPWPARHLGCPLEFVLTGPGRIAPVPGVIDHVVELAAPDVATRRALWRSTVSAAASWPADELDALAQRHRVTPGEIRAVAAHGVEDAAHASRTVREAARSSISQLAERLECTFGWSDLVLPAAPLALLRDLHFEAEERITFWEEPAARRLFPHGRGLVALFCGPPGTGKTMAAQVLARELGLDLHRVDLSTVVSKYIGETSKNLERVLAVASRMDAVILFDEADALFGKRTDVKDAHDRYANTDTNYLLQAIESYRGLALLATNKRGNIDSAFMRRLRHVIDFPAPGARERHVMWTRLVGELCEPERAVALDGVLKVTAQTLELSGAQIKYAVLNGVFAARRDRAPLSAAHIVQGVERELWKEGRGLSAADRERLVAHAR